MARWFVYSILLFCFTVSASAQTLEKRLLAESPAELARASQEQGDANRGAVVFHQPYLSCVKCHLPDDENQQLGPDLTKLDAAKISTEHLIESLLVPSRVIRKGYETVSVVTNSGKQVTGFVIAEDATSIAIRDAANNFKPTKIPKDEIDERSQSPLSMMPAGQVNSLASRQQFLDLLKYLTAIRDGGAEAAAELKPPAALFAARPLPDYESHIDHAGFIRDAVVASDPGSYKRGEAIYKRLCINCHGDHDKPGSLPTSLRFAQGKFKNGSDPYTMYQTLTRGFGMMVAQSWMVPEQKYDVINYIRQAYLKEHNPSQHFDINDEYLAALPAGDTRGPKPSNILPWEQMNYGPNLVATYEIGDDAKNFAYKGNAIRLDPGPGGVSQGRYWMVYDYDTLRVAAGWNGKGFINYQGINFDGRHNIHPRIVGEVNFQNPTGPGWAKPVGGAETSTDFSDPRLVGRDDRLYGPLPRGWAQYKGMYYHGASTIVEYTVGDTRILETPGVNTDGETPVFTRTFNIAPHSQPLTLRVARGEPTASISTQNDNNVAVLAVPGSSGEASASAQPSPDDFAFDGSTFVQIDEANDLKMYNVDFTIAARFRTKNDGVIFAKTADSSEWVRDGKSLFIRGGRLVYDIGWVGAVQSNVRVNDNKWHNIAMVCQGESGKIEFFVDGKPSGGGMLKPNAAVKNHVARIGFGAPDFPRPRTFFQGELTRVAFYRQAVDEAAINDAGEVEAEGLKPLAQWDLEKPTAAGTVGGDKFVGKLVKGEPKQTSSSSSGGGLQIAGVAGELAGKKWLRRSDEPDLLLVVPPSETAQRFTLWQAGVSDADAIAPLVDSLVIDRPRRNLEKYTHGGPSRWPEVLTTQAIVGKVEGPFAVDVLTRPEQNPWFCRMRLTGFDFYDDGDTAAVSSWDGNVYLVKGLRGLEEAAAKGEPRAPLTWRRIASGLFQPLGVKIVDGELFVTCRDQLCRLHDLNGDGEIDYYESFNNDHQVTDHFHEFAMGLQRDGDGNFYYAKSARHALKALVPHHGTLLKISPDGEKTEIIANGFRAANGVCLNPDGTFIVTDQEGHWNPKNRINWVQPGGFYGNMFGYHDITDSSDSAMQQPLCWITNSFDRSPAELLWVESERWGPLSGRLLNLSYGYGKVYVVPHEKVAGQHQGGMCELPIPQFPTGVMRGRFHPRDGQLYLAGMFAWAGNQHAPGGFYRLRYTGKPVHLPVELSAHKTGLTLGFTGELAKSQAEDPKSYSVKVWDLKRTASYGSKHYNEHPIEVTAAKLSADGKSVELTVPDIAPTWCMEISYRLQTTQGEPVRGVIHNTIHELK